MTNQEFKELAQKCHSNTASEEEKIAFYEAYDLMSHRFDEWDNKIMDEEMVVKTKIYQFLVRRVADNENIKQSVKTRNYRYAIAAIAFIIGVTTFFYLQRNHNQKQYNLAKEQVVPGKQGATLVLADGKKIILSAANKGKLAQEAGVVIMKTSEGELIYEIKDQGRSQTGQFNTLSTNKGETYQVRLPDGSLVWLNAASTIKYPVSFSGLKSRSVELSGEAYFEVAKNAGSPFIVQTDKAVIQVLGTHFNVTSYKDENASRTTLVEGKVSVSLSENAAARQTKILKPGEQGIIQSGGIEVKSVNVDEAIAWKNGEFMFNNEDIKVVMNKISRWYDVEIVYQSSHENVLIWGSISRFKSISDVLKLIELTGAVHFKVQGRRVLVM
jgi:transmembrane sensor